MPIIKGAVVIAIIICIVIGILMVPTKYLGRMCGSTGQVSVNYSGAVRDIAAAKAIMEANDKELETLAQQQHFKSYFVQMNGFNVGPNAVHNDNPATQVSYSKFVNFMVEPPEKAMDFAAVLASKGYQPIVNVSIIDVRGYCPQPALK